MKCFIVFEKNKFRIKKCLGIVLRQSNVSEDYLVDFRATGRKEKNIVSI